MPRAEPVEDRLKRRLAPAPNGCMIWTGATDSGGYGRIGGSEGGKVWSDFTHRVAYRLAKGEIPRGLHVDHVCRNRLCCNPDHLEAVTQEENNRRAASVRWAGVRLSDSQSESARRLLKSGVSQRKVAERLGVSRSRIRGVMAHVH